MKFFRLYILVAIMCVFVGKASAQSAPPNLPHFDDKTLHFGFILGYNTLSNNISTNDVFPYQDSIMSLSSVSSKGFTIGVTGDLRLFSFAHLRLTPTIAFADRMIDYDILKNDAFSTSRTTLEVIYLELPLEMKLQAKRWRNFRPYLIGGMKYSYDLGSIKRKKLSDNEVSMKVNDSELMYTLGVGFDFYLEYFKFGVELKTSYGLFDVLNHDYHTAYTDCIDKIRSQMFYINLTFE